LTFKLNVTKVVSVAPRYLFGYRHFRKTPRTWFWFAHGLSQLDLADCDRNKRRLFYYTCHFLVKQRVSAFT